jgi:hypothetical protein
MNEPEIKREHLPSGQSKGNGFLFVTWEHGFSQLCREMRRIDFCGHW